jgi:hypothetical protein
MTITYISEGFESATPPALPAGWASNRAPVTSTARAHSGSASLYCPAGADLYTIAYLASAPSSNGGDVRASAWFSTGHSTPSQAAFVVGGRFAGAPSGQTFSTGWSAQCFVGSSFAALVVQYNNTSLLTYSPAGFAALFVNTDWYQLTLDAVQSLDRNYTVLTVTIRRASDGKYLVKSGSVAAWQACPQPTPLCATANTTPGTNNHFADGIAYFGSYSHDATLDDVYVDDCLYQTYPFAVGYGGSPPSDEVEWIGTGIGSAPAAGTALANLSDGDFATAYASAVGTAGEGWAGIDLGSGVAGIPSRVLWAPRRGYINGGAHFDWDESSYLNMIEGSGDSTTWAGVGQVPGQFWFAGCLNDVPVDFTAAGPYRYFRLRSPHGDAMATELYFLGNRAAGVSWRPARPTITPGAGRYGAGKSVSIASLTSGASIYYTTDGSTPTTGSTPYAGPLALPSISSGDTYAIKAIAYHAGATTTASAVTQADFHPAEFVPDGGSTGFGTANKWPQDWRDDAGRLIESHFGSAFYDPGSGAYYWIGNPTCWGAVEALATGFVGYRSVDLYNWTFLGQVVPPVPLSFMAGGGTTGYGGTPMPLCLRPHVIMNASPGNPNNKYVLWCSITDGPVYGAVRPAAVATSPTPGGPYTWVGSYQTGDGAQTLTVADITIYEDGINKYLIYTGGPTGDSSTYFQALDPATDYTSPTGNSAILAASGADEAPVLFRSGGTIFLVNSTETPYAGNSSTLEGYRTGASIGAGSIASSRSSIWSAAPGSTSVPYHAQSTGIFRPSGRLGAILMFDFGAPGDATNPIGGYDLYHARHVWYPLPDSGVSGGAFAVNAPSAWDLSSLPAAGGLIRAGFDGGFGAFGTFSGFGGFGS